MKVRVLKEYSSAYPDPVAFREGDVIVLGRVDDEHPGWVRATTADGNEGWAPMEYLRITSPSAAIATTDYSAQELNAMAGELVEVIKHQNGWAWCLNIRRQLGWLPTGVLDSTMAPDLEGGSTTRHDS